MNKRAGFVGLELDEMDEIIDGNLKITDNNLRDCFYAVIIDTIHTLMEKNGFDEDDGEEK